MGGREGQTNLLAAKGRNILRRAGGCAVGSSGGGNRRLNWGAGMDREKERKTKERSSFTYLESRGQVERHPNLLVENCPAQNDGKGKKGKEKK